MNINSKGSVGKPGDKVLWDVDQEPEHTVSVLLYRWSRTRTDKARHELVAEAEAEVARCRYPEPVERPTESEEDRQERILTASEGWEPEFVERSPLGVTAREIKKLRKAHGLDVQTGRRLDRMTPQERRKRVAVLVGEGVTSPAEIARRLGEPNHWSALRDLRKLENAA